MKERAKEEKANKSKADGERDVLAKIAEMSEPDRAMAERIHAVVRTSAPDLAPRLRHVFGQESAAMVALRTEDARAIVSGWTLIDDVGELTERIEALGEWTRHNRPLEEDEDRTVQVMIMSQIAQAHAARWFDLGD